MLGFKIYVKNPRVCLESEHSNELIIEYHEKIRRIYMIHYISKRSYSVEMFSYDELDASIIMFLENFELMDIIRLYEFVVLNPGKINENNASKVFQAVGNYRRLQSSDKAV